MRTLQWWTSFLLATALSGQVLAQQAPSAVDIAVAKKLFAQAEEDEAADRWAAALDKLKRVLAIKETAGVRFHMALAQERLGQLMAAREDYKRSASLAQKLSPTEAAPLVDQATTAMTRLDTRLPTVTFTVPEVRGASVRVDGKDLPAGQFGKPMMRDLGEISVEASAPGRQPFSKRMVLIERNVITIEVTLPPVGEAAPVAPSPAHPETAPAPVSPPSSRSPLVPVVLLGSAVAFGGVSVFGFIKRRSVAEDTDSICGNQFYICDRAARDDRQREYTLVGVVGAGAAVISAGIGTYLLLRPDPAPSSAGVRLTPFGVAGRF